MLRIDDTSKTLLAPQASAFVTEAAPDPAELLTLLASSWDAFAAELGAQHLRLVAVEPAPGVDLLAFDEAAGRLAVVGVLGADGRDHVARALFGAARVASWDAPTLAAVHPALGAALPGDSPRVILVGGGADEHSLVAIDWLARRHGIEVSAFGVSVLRFGAERLLAVRRDFPPREGAQDPAAEVRRLLEGVGTATVAAPPAPVGPAPAGAPPASAALAGSAPPPVG